MLLSHRMQYRNRIRDDECSGGKRRSRHRARTINGSRKGCVRQGRPIAVSGIAQRPVECVARHLVRQGALVASDIYIGYASRLALQLSKYWTAVTHKLLKHLTSSRTPGVENRIPSSLAREALRVAPRMSWDRPPWIPLRTLRVAHGWSGLRSSRAIERIVASQTNSLHASSPTAHVNPRRSNMNMPLKPRRPFSSGRGIAQYAAEIWNVAHCPVQHESRRLIHQASRTNVATE
jgi:hypothetical protein